MTPIIHSAASQGVFSLAFWTTKDGVAVGGDYKEPAKNVNVAAVTHDGGKTWTLASKPPQGYRSAVAVGASHILVAVGTSGADVSHDSGNTWNSIFSEDLNALALIGNSGWAVGPAGNIISIHLDSH